MSIDESLNMYREAKNLLQEIIDTWDNISKEQLIEMLQLDLKESKNEQG